LGGQGAVRQSARKTDRSGDGSGSMRRCRRPRHRLAPPASRCGGRADPPATVASPPAARSPPADAAVNVARDPRSSPPTARAGVTPICDGTPRLRDAAPSARRGRSAPSTTQRRPVAFRDEAAFALCSARRDEISSSMKITMMPVVWRYTTSTLGRPEHAAVNAQWSVSEAARCQERPATSRTCTTDQDIFQQPGKPDVLVPFLAAALAPTPDSQRFGRGLSSMPSIRLTPANSAFIRRLRYHAGTIHKRLAAHHSRMESRLRVRRQRNPRKRLQQVRQITPRLLTRRVHAIAARLPTPRRGLSVGERTERQDRS
jgi:hypothetical protein